MNSFYFDHVSANCVEVDKSNSVLYVGLNSGYIGVVNLLKFKEESRFKGHDGPVNQMGINLSNSHLYTVGGDGLLNVFQ